jgi:hypothetical protein
MKNKILTGIIQKDATVKSGKRIFHLPLRGTDEEGYSEVLIDAKEVGGRGVFQRQSVKPYIGMKVEFILNDGAKEGFNYTTIK